MFRALWRILGSWYTPAILGLLLIAGFLWWVVPRPHSRVVAIDRAEEWDVSAAPPRREVVWETARPVAGLLDKQPNANVVSPRLTDGGATLYFTLRDETGQADIFRARLQDGGWQPAENVAELNTAADDIGPSLTPDGRFLYFYSNRPGGLGGFDLYVAERQKNGWSEPVNLGPEVNTPAHEYDPAIAPDGLALYFSSNRTAKHERLVDVQEDNNGRQWSATLRAHPGSSQFDLYVARRPTAEQPWTTPAPLTALNSATYNEGAPFVSPNGAFLYFASDKPARLDEPINLDLYRSRISAGEVGEAENLGPSVNTAAHETEPALSPEGFALVFSSNRTGRDAVYRSAATEVLTRTDWDTSRVQAIAAAWWQILLILFLLTLLLAVVWYSQGWLVEKASAARFFWISLLLHCLVLLLMWMIPLAQSVVQQANEIRDGLYATQHFDNDPNQADAGENIYSKVADLKPVESAAAPEVTRSATAAPEAPEITEPLHSDLPTVAASSLSPERIRFVPAPTPKAQREPLELPKQNVTPPQIAELAPVPVELPAAQPTPQEKSVPMADVAVARQEPAASVKPSLELPRQTANLEALRPAPVELDSPKPTLPEQKSAAPELAAKRSQSSVAASPAVELETVQLAKSTSPGEKSLDPTATALSVNRQQQAAPDPSPMTASAAAKTSPELPRSILPLDVHRPEINARPDIDRLPSQLARVTSRPLAPEGLDDMKVDAKLTGASKPAENPLAAADVALAREKSVLPDTVVAKQGLAPGLPSPLPEHSKLSDALGKPAAIPTPALETLDVALEKKLPLLQQQAMVDFEKVDLPKSLAPGNTTLAPSASRVAVNRQQQEGPEFAFTELKKNVQLNAAPLRSPLDVESPRTNSAPRLQTLDPLVRAVARPMPADPASLESTDIKMAAAEKPDEAPLTGASVNVNREKSGLPDPAVMRIAGKSGLPDPLLRSTMLTPLGKRSADMTPAIDPVETALKRRVPSATQFAQIEELPRMFNLRKEEKRKELIDEMGGSKQSEEAVERGLRWLVSVQNGDGSWSLHKFKNGIPGAGQYNSDSAGTGMALLPFLGAGYTHKAGPHQPQVEKGLDWLVKDQRGDGAWFSKGDSRPMYGHAIATIAMCEAFGLTQDPRLREPAQRGIDFIVKAQNANSGGWRYFPNQSADTSVTGWQVMALKSGEMAGLTVPKSTFDGVRRWLEKVEGSPGTFGYTNRGSEPAMTGQGLLCLQYLGASRSDPRLRAGAEYLYKHLPSRNTEFSYYWYHATQVMYHMQGKYWQAWNGSLRDLLVKSQRNDGKLAGSWDPAREPRELSAGRLYATSLRLLMLEVYYRHLPLYRQLDVAER